MVSTKNSQNACEQLWKEWRPIGLHIMHVFVKLVVIVLIRLAGIGRHFDVRTEDAGDYSIDVLCRSAASCRDGA